MADPRPHRAGPLGIVQESVRGSLWPLPTIGVLVAVATGVVLPEVDRAIAGDSGIVPFLFGGGASAARDSLAVIAGSLISVTGLVFSLTMIALQLSSSQYSPRLLQTFAADPSVRWTLTLLTMTFTFALVVMRTVRAEGIGTTAQGVDPFVPRLSVTTSYVLALASVLAVVLFLGHLARSLRVETMLRRVEQEASATIRRELGDASDDVLPQPVGPGSPVIAASSGFLVELDEPRLLQVATEADVLLLLVPRLGDSVVEGTPVAHAWPTRPGGTADPDALRVRIAEGMRLGPERQGSRDIAHGLRTIVDVVVRALSPGVNDPTTAVHALARVSALLGDLLGRPLGPRIVTDADRRARVVIRQWDAAALVRLALEEPVQFASGQPAVLRRLAALLREVTWRAPRGLVDPTLRELVRRVADQARGTTAIDDAECDAWMLDVEAALDGRWAPSWPETQSLHASAALPYRSA